MYNKKIFGIVALLLISTFCVTTIFAERKDILQIRKEYGKIISNKKKYITKKLYIRHKPQSEDRLPVHENITYYYQQDKVKCIISDKVGDMSGWVSEFYFKNKKLFFIFKYSWHGETRGNRSEDRFYFVNNKMIRWIDYQKEFVSDKSKLFKTEEKKLLNEAKEYLSKYKKAK